MKPLFAVYTSLFQFTIWFMTQMPEITEQGSGTLRIICGVLALTFSVLALIL